MMKGFFVLVCLLCYFYLWTSIEVNTILDPLSESQESLSHPSGRAGIMGGKKAEGKCPIFQTGVSKSKPCNLSSLGLVAQGPKQRALL